MVAPTVLPGVAFQQTKPNTSLLFHWRAQGRTLVTVDESSTGTLTRASAGGLTDGRGHVRPNSTADVRLVGPAADNQPRWGITSTNAPFLLLEDTRKNWQPISNPTTGWQVSSALSTGSETTVGPDGTAIRLLTDNSTAAISFMRQDVEVNSTVAIMTWYTKWNGSTFGAVHRMALLGIPDRGQVVWKFGSTGTMTLTSTGAGNVISAPTHIGNNWWKTSLECPGVIVAEDNQVEVIPLISADSTGGDMFIAHINVESVASTGLFASSHIPTAGAAVTRAAETLSWPFLAPPRSMTVYVKFIESGTAPSGLSKRLWHIGAAGSSVDPRITVFAGTGYRVQHDNGITETSSPGTLPVPTISDLVELRVVLNPDGSTTIGQSINGGAEVTASGAVTALGTGWAGSLLYLNSAGTSLIGSNAFMEIKIAPRAQTMQYMRESF